nr:hypothetical protein [uncultured Methanoregula sp.]
MTDDEKLYDIVIPPGVPRKLIIEISTKFDVKVVERMEKIQIANMDGDERELLAFRGKLDVMQQVEKYLLEQLKEFAN